MSIETVGPQKYAFQDLVCVAILLQLYDENDISFFVEPSNGEDAKISVSDSALIKEIDIQVKGAEGGVTLANVAEYLAHFPYNKAESCLFDRLVSNSSLVVVFVMSGRCNDETSCYLSKLAWPFNPHKNSKVKMDDGRELFKKFPFVLNTSKESSELEVKRYEYLKKMDITKYGIQKVRKALERLIIIEKIDEDVLMLKCGELLRQRHSIPDDRHQAVIERMRSVVFNGKGTKRNILPEFFSALTDFMPSPLRPSGYISHGLEEDWIRTLSEKSVLLMSGSPRVGKTIAAQWVAAEFSTKGYEVKETGDVGEAFRFLVDPSSAKRLVLMDDPFGDAHPTQNANSALTHIESIIKRLGSNRKLIIAQVQDRLLEVTSKNFIAEIKTAGHGWLDLSNPTSKFLSALWSQLQKQHKISEPLASVVLEALSKGELALEAGCLEYLAIHYESIDDPTDLDKIVRLAHENAFNLAKALKSENCKPFLLGLAATTNHNQSVATKDLAYALGSGDDKPLAISSILAIGVTIGEPSSFPKIQLVKDYSTLPQLSNIDEEVIEKLEQRRMIEWKKDNSLTFTHSFYRSAAEVLFQDGTRQSEEKIITILERGIFCLSPHTSRASARNLNWIYYSLKLEHCKAKLIELAIKALDSSYPSTRDIAFSFLIRNLSTFSVEIREDLPLWVSRVSWVSLNNVEWVDGEPVFPMGEKITIEEDLFLHWKTFEYNEELNLFAKEGLSFVQPKDACALIQMLGDHPDKMDQHIISKLLGYDEALIRAQAIWVWLKHPREKDKDILDQIFIESHPAIAKKILEGIMEVWKLANIERKVDLLRGLQKIACLPTTACVLIEPLIIYGRDDSEKDKSPWEVFEIALPSVLDALPASARINDARLFDIVQRARIELSIESMLVIIDSWIGYIERIAQTSIPSDYILGVTSILIETTEKFKESRIERVKRLLNLHGTGSLMRVISDLVDDWEELTEVERSLILRTLKEVRVDNHWLKAAVLMRDEIPLELEQEILHEGIYFKADYMEEFAREDSKLFLAAVSVYLGYPQVLEWTGLCLRGKNIWGAVVENIARDPLHPLFKNAWQEITRTGNGPYVATFVNEVGALYAEQVFEILLKIKVETTGNFMPEAWNALFDLITDKTIRSKWIKAMASQAFSVLDNLAEFKEWLNDEASFIEFINQFPNDKQLLILSKQMLDVIEQFKKNNDSLSSSGLLEIDESASEISEMRDQCIFILQNAFTNLPPLHYGTCDILRHRMKKMGGSTEILLEIDTYRKSLFDNNKNIFENKEVIAEVENWVW